MNSDPGPTLKVGNQFVIRTDLCINNDGRSKYTAEQTVTFQGFPCVKSLVGGVQLMTVEKVSADKDRVLARGIWYARWILMKKVG